MSDITIKVCGMKNAENIFKLAQLPIDIMGFIFYRKSPRYIGDDNRANTILHIPNHIQKAGVFVNEDIAAVRNLQEKYNLNIIQLHGSESPEYCRKLHSNSFHIIKAFQITPDINFEVLKEYSPYCSYFLFDTPTKLYGGSGNKFSWSILQSYNLTTPFFLSGGISENDITEILTFIHPQLYGIDINSKFEQKPGLKDFTKVSDFVNKIRNTH
ncbi:MAG: phosphoribosylanthranilate isomerase [Bacteroidales bacterium]